MALWASFIDYMADLREEIEQFDSIYFDETSHTLIKTIAQQEYNDAKKEQLQHLHLIWKRRMYFR